MFHGKSLAFCVGDLDVCTNLMVCWCVVYKLLNFRFFFNVRLTHLIFVICMRMVLVKMCKYSRVSTMTCCDCVNIYSYLQHVCSIALCWHLSYCVQMENDVSWKWKLFNCGKANEYHKTIFSMHRKHLYLFITRRICHEYFAFLRSKRIHLLAAKIVKIKVSDKIGRNNETPHSVYSLVFIRIN